MPLEDFLKAVDTIPLSERPNNFTVAITGGEPLLRPDIEEIGKAIRQRGLLWGMVSNGFLYDEQIHCKLMRSGMGSLTISLDGMEDSHDWMRGREGSFRKAIRGIRTAAAERKLNFDVVTCVTKRNLNQLQEIHDALLNSGVKQWRIFTVIPIGRAKDDPMMHLDESETRFLMEFIKDKRKLPSKMNVTFSCEGFLGKYEQKARLEPYFCRAGINIASVLIDGTICACPNIDRDIFAQGNIYKDNLWEVWNSRFEKFRDRSWARMGQCADCNVFDKCLGNGMHNWHGDCSEVLNCHYKKTL